MTQNSHKTYYLVCEGKIEWEYIKFLKNNFLKNKFIKFVPLIIKGTINSKIIDSNSDKKAIYIIDEDAIKKEKLMEIVEKITNQNNEVILNIPCFEFFLLHHFEKINNTNLSKKEIIKRLEKHIDNAYDKKIQKFEMICKKFINEASVNLMIKQMSKIDENLKSNIKNENYTNFYLLIKILKNN